METEFGHVNRSLTNTLFDPSQIDAHMKAMFPSYTGQTSVQEESNAQSDADDNIDTDDEAVPAKRPRLCSQDSVAHENANFSFDLHYSAESEVASDMDEDSDDDGINESVVKLHDQIKQLKGVKQQKITALKSEVKRLKRAYADCQAKFDKLSSQLNAATVKQTNEIAVLKNGHNAKVKSIVEVHNKAMAKMNKSHEQIETEFKAKLQEKEATIAKMQEENTKQEMELQITANILDKAKQDVEALKICTGCKKRLERLCAQCDAVW